METEQNLAMLREGVVIVSRDGTRVGVAGFNESRVRDVASRVLGDGVEIDVVGRTARQIWARPCLAYREREPGRLQLRIEIIGDEHVDEIVVAEDDQTVAVYATVCTATIGQEGESCDVPHHVWLDQPLGERVVIDGTTGDPLQLRRAPRRE